MKLLVTKEELEREYIQNENTVRECAEIFGISVGAVFLQGKNLLLNQN